MRKKYCAADLINIYMKRKGISGVVVYTRCGISRELFWRYKTKRCSLKADVFLDIIVNGFRCPLGEFWAVVTAPEDTEEAENKAKKSRK
nr:MAG TPA: helix-turn-helix domain protein [Caudoviricetes sp.]